MKNFFKSDSKTTEINYLYFSFVLIFLSFLSFSHFLCMEKPLFGLPLFFLIYALGQALLEVFTFILIAYLLKRWAPKWLFMVFISLSFALLLVHFTDFTLIRILDDSISYLFKFFLGSGFDHVVTAFLALNMNGTMIGVIGAAVVFIPLLGLLFYWLTYRVSRLKPVNISLRQIATILCSIGAALLLLDLVAHPFLDRQMYGKYQKKLPFGTAFLSPSPYCIQLPAQIAPPRDEKKTLKQIPKLSIAHLPNIYFFVIETLRRDYVNTETAPHLSSFGKENIEFASSFANASFTNLSWFALFHADYPYHWTAMRDRWKGGSIPLQFLRKLGYKTRVYSAANLRYFNMDKLIFGEKRELGDQIEEYVFNRNLEPCDRDALAFDSFYRDLLSKEGREANVFIFFLDSTHSEYSIPKDFPLRFEPSAKEIGYLTLSPEAKELDAIKNRYRNAICYVDSLMGHFFDRLKKENLFDDAIVAITGDHGEEFFEKGALFHGTHLNRYQTNVPIYLKVPSKDWVPLTQEATHMDLFPSILHYLSGRSDFSSLFDGQSVFSPNRWPYRIAVLQNGPDTPCEFTIEQGSSKLTARFLNPRTIYEQRELEIISLETPNAEPIESENRLDFLIKSHFPNAFDPLLIGR